MDEIFDLTARINRKLRERVADLEDQVDQAQNPNVNPSSTATPGIPCDTADLGLPDMEAAFNMRDWLKEACEANGAKMTGGGFGFGQADIDILLDGCAFNVSIKPIVRE